MSATDTSQTSVPVKFSGQAGEYFGIWIVNLLLSIITIGIYSAWAKVRTLKYFYRNTTISGRGFDYHATGGQILIGRLIVIGAYIVLNILVAITGGIAGILLLGLPFLIPYLIIRATQFQARNTSWSNVRFNFEGDYWDAFVTFILLPIGVALTFYLTIPFLTRRINRFVINGHSLGNHQFKFDNAPIGGFYKAFLLPFLWALIVTVLAFVLVVLPLIYMTSSGNFDPNDPIVAVGPILMIYAILFIGVLPASVLYSAMVRNLVYANTGLQGGHRFESTVGPFKLLWIVISNAVVIVCTFGLMLPWASIRSTRYLANQTTVHPNGPLDDFAGKIEQDGNAIGDAFGDFEGIDVGAAGI